MDILDCIKTRKSIRAFKDKQVEFEKIANTIEAANFAPSAGNLQDWKIILVTEDKLRRAVSDACEQQVWMDSAPVHLVICSEPVRMQRLYGKRGEEIYSIQNAAAAAQNALLAAHAQGLGACWVGAFNELLLKEALNIDESVIPRAVIVIGYPAEKPEQQKKLTVLDVTFIEKWGNKIRDLAAFEGNYYKKVQGYKEKVEKVIEKAKKIIRA